MNWKKDEYLASWPKAVPYPYALARSKGPVPNRSSVDWPQAQWAPLYLPPGSASVQPYRYPADQPVVSIVRQLHMLPPTAHAPQGPSGDIVATPSQSAPGAYSCTEVEMIEPSYGAVSGPVVRQGMMVRNNCCNGYGSADCNCGSARMNPEEGEESFLEKNKWLLLGAAAVGAFMYYRR
jgi:hypothetical protein